VGRIRSRLTYANVMATLAVFLVLAGGTALAAVMITSNSQVGQGVISGHQPPRGKHPNIIGRSINGRDIAGGSIKGADLAPSALPKAKTRSRGFCNPDEGFFIPCGQVPITLARPARVLILVTGTWRIEPRPPPIGSEAEGECQLTVDYGAIDGTAFSGSSAPAAPVNESSLALSYVVGPLTGRHIVGVQCRERRGDITYSGITISAVTLSPAGSTFPPPPLK
jgi:hypothetical protein